MLNTFLSISTSSRTRPRWLLQRSSRSYTIFVVSYAVFVDIFLYGVIVPVIPFALQQRIGIPFENVQHWVSILLAVYGGSLLFFSVVTGYWADKTETRRWPFLTGLALLAGATVMLCLARSIAVLLLARILQGASAAVVWTVAVTVMTDRIGTKDLGQAMGYVALGRSVAIVIGPLLGGVVYARAGYYAVYAMVFSFLVLDIVFRLVLIESRVAKKWDPSIAPLDGEVKAKAVEDSTAGINMTSTVAPDATSCLTHSQRRGKISNLLPPTITLFANPRVAVALWGCFWQASLLCGCDAVIPIFVKRTFGWNSFGAGLIFLAVVIPGFISPVVGYLSDKYGPKWLSVFGYVACAPPLILLRLVGHNSTQQKVLLAALLSLLGGFCMFFEIPLWVEIIRCVEEKMELHPDRYGKNGSFGQAYGLVNLCFAAGVMVGPIWAGFVYQEAGWGTMAWSFGLVSALSAIPTALFTGGNIFTRRFEIVHQDPEGTAATEEDLKAVDDISAVFSTAAPPESN